MTGHKLLIVEPYRIDEKNRDRLVPTGRTFVAVDALGALGVLVNNAGIVAPTVDVEDVDAERVTRLFAVNVVGPFLGLVLYKAEPSHLLPYALGALLLLLMLPLLPRVRRRAAA